MNKSAQNGPVCVAALYKFFPLADPEAFRDRLQEFCDAEGIKGTLIVAGEGINGTVAGSDDAIARLVDIVTAVAGADRLEIKYSRAEEMPFYRMKVRVKREIVTMGAGVIDPVSEAGAYVDTENWNALISDPETVVIDTRNEYEVDLGTFRGAISPQTETFREFPAWVAANRDKLEGRKVAMFCTGGIRCEKATAYVRSLGIGEVYHLHGGILRYLENVEPRQSLWQGECFVFDERVAVVEGLRKGEAELCRACRHPLTPEDRKANTYELGVSCPYCHDERSDADKKRYRQRQRQVELADRRGDRHIGR